MKKKIVFIVNPISGGRSKIFIPALIDKYLNHNTFDANIVFTERVGHAFILAKEALAQNADVVISVGGDGTINEVASAMVLSGKTMGIVPCGSGNGLARTLKIPLNHIKAIERINKLETIYIDSGVLNDKKFFNMAGLGFDAHISALFAKDKTRGLKGYIKSTFTQITHYKPQNYRLEIDDKIIEEEAFMLSIANSSQYGNNVHISPTALVNDGLFDVCLVKRFPLYSFPNLGLRMLLKTIQHSSYVTIIKAKQVKITREKAGPVHLDGEPLFMPKEISVSINPLSLKLIV
ncbi:MAG: diacylglycerol kinase family lipid kinase [Sphingobacteriales bacterium]|nr:MAG: diacylglycerol kinase family lipid kinase [Sphingobacteriales bacterium]